MIYKDEAYQIVGACFEVYNEFGNGFDEAVYHESLLKELAMRKVVSISEPRLHVFYKGEQLEKFFKPDIVCFGKIILELKTVRELSNEHRQQVHNYLKATGYKLGLLINFGAKGALQYERIVKTK